jgi:hypothetical protein
LTAERVNVSFPLKKGQQHFMNNTTELAQGVPTMQVIGENDILNLKSQSISGGDICTVVDANDCDCDCVEED